MHQPSVCEAVRLSIDDVQILQTVRSNRMEELRDFLETITPEQNEELQTDFSDTCVYDYIRKEMIVCPEDEYSGNVLRRGDVWQGERPGCVWYNTHCAYMVHMKIMRTLRWKKSFNAMPNTKSSPPLLQAEHDELKRDLIEAMQTLPDCVSKEIDCEDGNYKSVMNEDVSKTPTPAETRERLAQFEMEALQKTTAVFNSIRQTRANILCVDSWGGDLREEPSLKGKCHKYVYTACEGETIDAIAAAFHKSPELLSTDILRSMGKHGLRVKSSCRKISNGKSGS